MEYLFSSAHADPWILWILRGLMLILAVYIAWTLYSQRRNMGAALAAGARLAREFGDGLWQQWGPVLNSRANIGGLIQFAAVWSGVVVSAQQQETAVTIIMALAGTVGLVLVFVGRIFAQGPIRMHRPLIGAGQQAEIEAKLSDSVTVEAADFRRFMDERPGAHVFGIGERAPSEAYRTTGYATLGVSTADSAHAMTAPEAFARGSAAATSLARPAAKKKSPAKKAPRKSTRSKRA